MCPCHSIFPIILIHENTSYHSNSTVLRPALIEYIGLILFWRLVLSLIWLMIYIFKKILTRRLNVAKNKGTTFQVCTTNVSLIDLYITRSATSLDNTLVSYPGYLLRLEIALQVYLLNQINVGQFQQSLLLANYKFNQIISIHLGHFFNKLQSV